MAAVVMASILPFNTFRENLSNSGYTDEMPLYVAFHQGLHQGLHSLQRQNDLPSGKYNTKPVLSGNSKIDETKVLKA